MQQVPSTSLHTERLALRFANRTDALALQAYYLKNKSHLQLWDPLRSDDFYTTESIVCRLEEMERQTDVGSALHFLIYALESNTLLGTCHFTNIVRGPFQACHLGFSISEAYQGKGLTFEALSEAIKFVFDVAKLHRIMANYQSENVRSARLLQKLGFEIEGRARSYLKINGEWADHVLSSKINDQT